MFADVRFCSVLKPQRLHAHLETIFKCRILTAPFLMSELTSVFYPLIHFSSNFFADDLKLLRVAMSSFFDMLLVCSKTLMEFDSSIPTSTWDEIRWDEKNLNVAHFSVNINYLYDCLDSPIETRIVYQLCSHGTSILFHFPVIQTTWRQLLVEIY